MKQNKSLTLEKVMITAVRRAKSSANGNPAFDVAFMQMQENGLIGQSAILTTAPDASIGYAVSPEMIGCTVDVVVEWASRKGCCQIIGINR